MGLLGLREGLEPLGDLIEALFASRPGHPRVHVGVFVGFTGNGGPKIILGRTDRLAGCRIADFLQILEMAMGMAGLTLGGRAEYRRHVIVALDIGLLSEVEISAVGLAFAGESRFEIFFGLRILQ